MSSQPPESIDGEAEESAEKKLEVVTKAFQSLTEKKSKIEASFQADKKNLVVSFSHFPISPTSDSVQCVECQHYVTF